MSNKVISNCYCGGGEFSVRVVKSTDHHTDYRVKCHRCLRAATCANTIQGATDRWNEAMERNKNDD